jgi:hypothetical protein
VAAALGFEAYQAPSLCHAYEHLAQLLCQDAARRLRSGKVPLVDSLDPEVPLTDSPDLEAGRSTLSSCFVVAVGLRHRR